MFLGFEIVERVLKLIFATHDVGIDARDFGVTKYLFENAFSASIYETARNAKVLRFI